jgi:predicted amino acid racemase
MGEGIFFGFDTSGGAEIPGFERGAFTLFMEIVEIREKIIVAPNEQGGKTALGGEPLPQKTGKRRRAVLDTGALAAPLHDLRPVDPNITLAGQTYDFTVVDITDSSEPYATGGFIAFTAEYAASARAMLNCFVNKIVQ